MTLITGIANATLAYQSARGVSRAKFRVKQIDLEYGVNGDSSVARRWSAFYPRRRNIGTFAITFDFVGWAEYDAGMNWFKGYADTVLSNRLASAMRINIPARNFSRLGVPVDGISFGDHTASMVFSPKIGFITIANPLDVKKPLKAAGISRNEFRQGQTSTTWFYPGSSANRPGQLDAALYGLANGLVDVAEAVSGPQPPVSDGSDLEGRLS